MQTGQEATPLLPETQTQEQPWLVSRPPEQQRLDQMSQDEFWLDRPDDFRLGSYSQEIFKSSSIQ